MDDGLRGNGRAINKPPHSSAARVPHEQGAAAKPLPIRSPLRRPAPPAAPNAAGVPLALALIVITTFLPQELSFNIFGLRFTATRLILLLLPPVLVLRLGQRIAAGRYRFVLSDLLVVLAGLWMIIAPANVDGLGPALNHSGPLVLEFCIGYFAVRALLSKHGQALSLASLLCKVIAIVAMLGLLDPLTNEYFVRSLAGQLTGIVKGASWLMTEDSHRLGLLRASSTVEHPILFGAVCGIGLIIATSVPVRGRAFATVSCMLGAIFAFSSAPMLGIAIGLALLIYNRIVGDAPFRWLALAAIGAIGIAATFLISKSPVGFVISHMTFDPSSGYYRVWTWTSVINAVSMSPWYGLGFGSHPDVLEINHSIDSLWLAAAILFGLPGTILIALAMIGSVSLPTSGPRVSLAPAESKLGTTLGIVIFLIIFLSFTVDLWGTTWILAGLLMGMRAHLGELGRLPREAPRRRPVRPAATALIQVGPDRI